MSVLAVVLLVIFAIALLLALRMPNSFHVERTQRIEATPDRIFPLIDDLQAHARWSPFDQPDPKTTSTCSTPSHGAGAEKIWSGNGKSGAGRFFITRSTPMSRVEAGLQMTKPMSCDNRVVFMLNPIGAATDVTWAMSGDVALLPRILHAFVGRDSLTRGIDKMCGSEFDKGLAALKNLVEQP